MDTTETMVITAVSSALSAFLSSFATSKKMRNEGDALLSNAVAARTQQLFDNLTKTVDRQALEINSLKTTQESLTKSLSECHQQHAEATKHYNDTITRLERLEAAMRSPDLL